MKVVAISLAPTLCEDPFPLLTALDKSVGEKCKLVEDPLDLFVAQFAETDDVESLINALKTADTQSIEEICEYDFTLVFTQYRNQYLICLDVVYSTRIYGKSFV